MCATCMYVSIMPKMIQLRNVPDSLHRKLKARAALEGLSLSDYLLTELQRYANRPTLREVCERLSHRRAVRTKVPPADAVREDRERS
jgi:plasmid stability protein